MIKRGDIYYADLGVKPGSVQGGLRPVVVIQNDVGNAFSSTTIVLPLTTKIKRNLPTHTLIKSDDIVGLDRDSLVLSEQVLTIDKNQLKDKLCTLNAYYMQKIKESMEISFGFVDISPKKQQIICA